MARTGPRSPQAKAIVSANAVRHGLRSPRVVIPGLESQTDWETFLARVIRALKPVGAVEHAYAERVASLHWRLRRVYRAERDAAIALGKRRDFDDDPESNPLGRLIIGIEDEFGVPEAERTKLSVAPRPPEPPALFPAAAVFEALSRYEARLSRQLDRALHELQALQDRRMGKHTPLARVDVDVQGTT
jgi:hypothetical protein